MHIRSALFVVVVIHCPAHTQIGFGDEEKNSCSQQGNFQKEDDML